MATKEVKIDTIPAFKLEEVNIPWITEDKLDASLSVRWISAWSIKTLTFTRASTVWTGNQSFTWFWFIPKSYTIIAWRNVTWDECMSNWWIDSVWTQWGVRTSPVSAWWVWESSDTNKVIRIFFTNAWWWETNASHVSMDSDWITVNFWLSAENIKFTLTCYW